MYMINFKCITFLFLMVRKFFEFEKIENRTLKFEINYKYVTRDEKVSNTILCCNQTTNSFENISNSICEFQINTRYVYLSDESIIFSKFEKFSDIIPACNQTYNVSEEIFIEPVKDILIDKNFQVEKLFKEDQIGLMRNINLGNIRGIDVQSSFLNRKITSSILIGFSFSKLDIYLDEKILNASECNTKVYNNLNNFFQHFSVITFSQVSYPKNELCPLIFLNSVCKLLIFEDITNSFLTRNKLKFSQLNVSDNFDLGTKKLAIFHLFLYYENLSNDIMNKHLFKRVRELIISKTIATIEVGLLKGFKFLKNIDFKIDNFRHFFHQGNYWFHDLNKGVSLNLNRSNLSSKDIMRIRFQYQKTTTSFDNYYEYPDEDLCLFKDFPHNRSVFAILEPGKSLACTCTLLWIQFYHYMYEPYIKTIYNPGDMPEIYYLSHVINTTKYCSTEEKKNLKCNFESKFKNCKVTLPSQKTFHLDNDIDYYFLVKWLQFVLLTILQPILAFLGLVNNILTIMCIKNSSKKKSFQDPMYKHILINSLYNSVYCIIMALKLINTCIFYINSVFCSSLYQYESAQYFKIILVMYFGNVMKMCSNLSYISFTFSRFILVSNLKEKKLFKTFNNMRLEVYFFAIFFLCCFLNSFILFQYTLNKFKDFRTDFPYEKRNEVFCEKEENKFQCTAFNIMKIINKFFNDVVSVCIILVIDLFLLNSFHKNLKSKMSAQFFKNDPEHFLNAQKSKKNINRMILASNIIYALAHMPEFISTIMLVLFIKKIEKFCEIISCDILNEEAQFFCLISIVCQFYIFIKFKKTFKSSLKDLMSRFSKKKSVKASNVSSKVYTIELKNLKALIGDGKID